MMKLLTFRSVRIGELESATIVSQLEAVGFLGESARELIRSSPGFRMFKTAGTINLTVLTLKEMGFNLSQNWKVIFDRAFLRAWSIENLCEQEIGLCSPEVAPALMIQCPLENFPSEVIFAMQHLAGHDGCRGKRAVFRMGRNEDGIIYLRAKWVQGNHLIYPNQRLVFALNRT